MKENKHANLNPRITLVRDNIILKPTRSTGFLFNKSSNPTPTLRYKTTTTITTPPITTIKNKTPFTTISPITKVFEPKSTFSSLPSSTTKLSSGVTTTSTQQPTSTSTTKSTTLTTAFKSTLPTELINMDKFESYSNLSPSETKMSSLPPSVYATHLDYESIELEDAVTDNTLLIDTESNPKQYQLQSNLRYHIFF